MRKLTALIPAVIVSTSLCAQIDAGLFRYPDVSKSHIVFTYANDIWVMPKDGGTAIKLSSPPGVESFPKFSPDGNTVAFSGNYDGNTDVYTIPESRYSNSTTIYQWRYTTDTNQSTPGTRTNQWTKIFLSEIIRECITA